ncbi:MAG: glycosyltransferase family 2 protein [Acidobacteriota bacterium]
MLKLKKISVAIITSNEEAKIGRTLASVREIADEIVIVDSFSTDGTAQICAQFGCRFLRRKWEGYRKQKQFATDQTLFDWVLSLDADEAVSPELKRELLGWKRTAEAPYHGYRIPRRTFFMGRWIQHTTWYPDWQLRLFCKSRGRWQGRRVHESFQVQGPTGKLQGALEHYSYASVSEYLEQLERFSTLAAADYYERGIRARFPHLLLYPSLTFLNNYLLRRGFLDGLPGLAVSTLSAVSTFFKYLKLRELQSGLVAVSESLSKL